MGIASSNKLHIAFSLAFITLCSAGMPFVASAVEEDPTAILRNALRIQEKMAISGRAGIVLAVDDRMIDMEAMVYKNGPRMRMECLTPPLKGRIMIDDGRRIAWIDPSTRWISIRDTLNPILSVDLFLKNYKAELMGEERVAGIMAYGIKASPLKGSGPYIKIWIGKENPVILKMERYNSSGRLISRIGFKEVELKERAIDPDMFSLPKGWRVERDVGFEREIPLSKIREVAGFEPIIPSYVPKGYEFIGASIVSDRGRFTDICLRYSDGLGTISIYEGMIAGFGRGRMMGGRGPRFTMVPGRFGNMAVMRGIGMRVVIVGDLPDDELRKIGESIMKGGERR
jgi:negative regulator of sigma E activity